MMADRQARGTAPPPQGTADSSHAVWRKFFERHQALPIAQHGQRRPPVSSGRYKGSTGPEDTKDSYIFAQHRQPRRSHSAKDLGSPARNDENVGSNKARPGRAYDDMLSRLRRLILLEGIPGDDFSMSSLEGSPARPLIWKILLDVRTIDAAHYLALVARGPSAVHDKIRDDAFRTLATDRSFTDRVDETALIRMLDAFVWYFDDNEDEVDEGKREGQARFSYVQGMNVLAAPFLYVMPSELEAFHCFCNFIQFCCPTYVQPTLIGVHAGLQLVETCLEIADPALSSHLRGSNLNAEVYAFPSVLTLCACTPPLKQVLQIWDYLLAFGTHLAVPCVVAQLLLIRDELTATTQPMRLLRQFPDLDARSIIGIATTLVRDLDDGLYEDLVQHTLHLR